MSKQRILITVYASIDFEPREGVTAEAFLNGVEVYGLRYRVDSGVAAIQTVSEKIRQVTLDHTFEVYDDE